jgi:hypothetical protein
MLRLLMVSILWGVFAAATADDSYLCVGDAATGFAFESGRWQASSFSPEPTKFLIGPAKIAQPRRLLVADLNNPVLTQFAKDGLKTANDMVLRGFAMYARESRCWSSRLRS